MMNGMPKPTGRAIESVNGKWMTTAEACINLGVTPGRIRQFVAEGRLTIQKFGRVNVFDAGEVAALASQDRKPGRPKKAK